jgi:hypothetical protein
LAGGEPVQPAVSRGQYPRKKSIACAGTVSRLNLVWGNSPLLFGGRLKIRSVFTILDRNESSHPGFQECSRAPLRRQGVVPVFVRNSGIQPFPQAIGPRFEYRGADVDLDYALLNRHIRVLASDPVTAVQN